MTPLVDGTSMSVCGGRDGRKKGEGVRERESRGRERKERVLEIHVQISIIIAVLWCMAIIP